MPTNDFQPFATGTGAYVETQTAYLAEPALANGFTDGVANTPTLNKVWRQATFPVAAIAQHMANITNTNILDDGNNNEFIRNFWLTLISSLAFTDSGTANSLVIAPQFGLAFPGPNAGTRITVKVNAANTGASTLSWMGTTTTAITYPDQTPLQGGEFNQGGYADLIYDGAEWQLLTVPLGPKFHKFDAVNNPPSSDILLNPGDRALITFTAASTIPLHIRTVQGVYQITQIVTQSSAANTDVGLLPNNTTYSGAFTRYAIETSDLEITALGTASTPAVGTTITVSPFVSLIAQTATISGLNEFFIDTFLGPTASDTLNDVGPYIIDYTISTYTPAKMIKTTSVVKGGSAVSGAYWADTTTAWTSLGTMQIMTGSPAPTQTGTMIVTRIF